jgi:hypothetical protein
MSPEWTVQLRRYALVFLAPLALGAALGTLYLTVRRPPLAGPCEMAYLLFVVLVWFGLLGYAVRELFAFFYLGRNALLQLAPGGRGRTLVRLAAVFIAYLLPCSPSPSPSASRTPVTPASARSPGLPSTTD